MKKRAGGIVALVAAGCLFQIGGTLLAQETPPMNWDRAWTLLQKEQRGEPLTPEEKAYLDRAKELRRRNGQGTPGTQTARPGGNMGALEDLLIKQLLGSKLTADEEAQLEQGRKTFRDMPSGAGHTTMGFKPIMEMSATDTYKGEKGGLYGGGLNAPPAAHLAGAEKALAQIRPLDDSGSPAPDGKIVLLSIGMSNTTMEFSSFKRLADRSPLKNPRVVLVDGAQGARTANVWAQENMPIPGAGNTTPVWEVAAQRLRAAGVTERQVQAIWLKQALPGPSYLGEYPAHARRLQNDLQGIVVIAKRRYPNLRVVYLSSRIYAGFATSNLNPEPYAYESAFAVRGLILDQIAGKPELNYDLARGEVKAPVLLWGPYLWGDGATARSDNGLVWTREDFVEDGTHPSPFGRAKVSGMLYGFLTTSPLARTWFVKP